MSTPLKQLAQLTKPGLGLGSITAAAITGTAMAGSEAAVNDNKGLTGKDVRPITPIKYDLGNLTSGGANLKIGGMFGAGENKLITLNTKMVELLGQIQNNTKYVGSPGKQYEFQQKQPKPTRQAGGI